MQPFTPCQLRFLVLLFMDRWFFLATVAAMLGIVCMRLSTLVASLSSLSSHAQQQGQGCSGILEEKEDDEEDMEAAGGYHYNHHHHVQSLSSVQSSFRKPMGTAPSSPAQANFYPMHQMAQMPGTNNSMDIYASCPSSLTSAAAAAPPPAAAGLQQLSAADSSPAEDDMAAMFRLARKAAAGRMGEMI